MLFVGRKKEMEKLERMYKSKRFEFAVIYGRRRVGKTTLIREFCKGKKAVYSVGRENNPQINLEAVSRDIYHVLQPNAENNSIFTSWEAVFDYIEKSTETDRLILVLDEYPYFAGTCPELSSILQAHIDQKLKLCNLFLILCGSSMSFMENQVLGYKSPLYGRRTAQFKLLPLKFRETQAMLTGFSKEEQAILYSVTGGIPEYLSQIRNNLSVKENLVELFFSDSGTLYEEPENLMKQELREPATYNDIITAIAKGASRLNEISTKIHIDSNKCAKYISSLLALGIVKKEQPITEANSRKSIYLLDDQMFRFWYSFVLENMSRIISGDGDIIYDKIVVPQMPHYMGLAFEEICKEYLMEMSSLEKTPFFFQKLGRWWGTNTKEKRQEEIDILAFFENRAAFCECKWRKELVGVEILEELILKSLLFPQFTEKYYYIFSKNGFTQELLLKAQENSNCYLISFDEM